MSDNPFKNLIELLGKNIEKRDALTKASMKQNLDRMTMRENPEIQGPPLPETTPEEEEFTEQQLGTAMGSLRSVPKMPGYTPKELVAKEVVDAAKTLPEQAMGVQKLSREADFAERLRKQLMAKKLLK